MAPISSRRSGHSRRAQYSLFTGYALAVLGALIGAALLVVSLWNPGAFSGLRSAAADTVKPGGSAGAETRAATSGVLDTIAAYWRAGSQNEGLRREVELARIRLAEAEALEQENRELKTLLGLKQGETQTIAVARLIGSSATSGRRFAYLDAGASSGVAPGMPVRSAQGVIGRVLETGNSSARVMLLTDSESVLPVKRAGDDLVAFAEGRGDGKLRIRLLNLGINPLKKGDFFVTSGAGGYFRPGIAAAILEEVTPDGGVAHVVADPAAATAVMVEQIWVAQTVEAARSPQEEAFAPEAEDE
ncbi:MAG: rod shape-determining protein MreC [Erythrobacter sp. RIFCSPHIGHO2_12_FULL_63_10]|nr:MAG: rod shape-determining protein MreC [Erythrobacter sp. RIFCSPHIGHO2_12_FULL_63_10]